MSLADIRSGDFVWTMFPYEQDPDTPGPIRHAACVIAAFDQRNARQITGAAVPSSGLVVGVFTSSQVERFGERLPVGVIKVSSDHAKVIGGQKPFFIDVRKRAFIPFTKQFFPEIDKPTHGVIGSSTKSLFSDVKNQFRIVNERYNEQIVNLGPLRPPGG